VQVKGPRGSTDSVHGAHLANLRPFGGLAVEETTAVAQGRPELVEILRERGVVRRLRRDARARQARQERDRPAGPDESAPRGTGAPGPIVPLHETPAHP
jgi:hypothetical protein